MADIPATPWQRIQQGRRARKSEEAAAKTLGGRRQPASGSKWYAKGDLRANGFLIDDKYTDDKSFRITVEMWRKIESEAGQTPPGLRPSLRISLPGLPKLRVVLEDDLMYLMAQAEDDKSNEDEYPDGTVAWPSNY